MQVPKTLTFLYLLQRAEEVAVLILSMRLLASPARHSIFSMGQSVFLVVVVNLAVVEVTVGPLLGGEIQASELRIATRAIIKVVSNFMMMETF